MCEYDLKPKIHDLVSELSKLYVSLPGNESEFTFIKKLENHSYKDFVNYINQSCSKERNLISKTIDQALQKENILHKSDEKSEKLRIQGNQQFVKKAYKEALKFYLIAMTFSESDKIKALCYGNISACFFQIEKYDFCIVAVRKAKEHHKVKDAFYAKISEREKKSLEFYENNGQPNRKWNILPLSYPENPRNKELADCLEKRSDGIFTKQALKIGDIVAITKSFIKGPWEVNDYVRCNNCWMDASAALEVYPAFTGIHTCDNCVYSLYCSAKCKAEDSRFHSIICKDAYRVWTTFSKYGIMAMKFAFEVLSRGIDIREKEYQNSSTNFFDWKKCDFEERLKVFCSLKTNRVENTKGILITFFAILEQLKKSGPIKEFFSKFDDGEELFFRTFWKGYQVAHSNSISLEKCSEIVWETTHVDLLFGSFNHQCIPNVFVFRHFNSYKNHYVVLEKVKAGEELFVAYG